MRLVIVGNSAAALTALESFRREDPDSAITMVTDEAARPYSRVLLPYFLRGRIGYEGLFIRRPDYHTTMGVRALAGVRVEHVDAAERRVELADGRRLDYDRLLLATGSRPARPRIPGLGGPAVCHLWTLDDALRLCPLLRAEARVLVLGSGFVALQTAWVARQRGARVTVAELEDRIMPTALDATAAAILQEQVEAQAVGVLTGLRTESVERDESDVLHVTAAGMEPLATDVIVVATGARPNDQLLPEALEPGRPGIPVTATMETTVTGVFAAGDVARGPLAGGGSHEIHALWPTAVEQGEVAGANLAGAEIAYEGSLNMNVTEMFGWTVATLGTFVPQEGDELIVRHDLPGVRYLRLVLRDGVPVGAVAMGSPEVASLLGRLRPYARHRRSVRDLPGLLEGRTLPALLARRITPARKARSV